MSGVESVGTALQWTSTSAAPSLPRPLLSEVAVTTPLPVGNPTRFYNQALSNVGSLRSAPAEVSVPPINHAAMHHVYDAVPDLRPQQAGTQTAVRWESLVPTGSEAEIQALKARYKKNARNIDAMLDPSTTRTQKRSIHRELGILPPALVERARQSGLKIWVVPEDATHVPARLVKPDAASHSATVAEYRDYRSQVAQYNHQIKSLQARIHADPTYRNSPHNLSMADRFSALAHNELSELNAPEKEAARRLRLHVPSMPHGPRNSLVDTALPGQSTQKGTFPPPPPPAGGTIADVARQHGASSAGEVSEFVSLVRDLNAVDGKHVDGQTHLHTRQSVVLPDRYYYHGQALNGATRQSLENTNRALRDRYVRGETNPYLNVLWVKSPDLQDPAPIDGHHRTLLHEFGHETHKLLTDKHGKPYEQAVSRAYDDDYDKHCFSTDYSCDNKWENYADGFEAYYTRKRADGVRSGDASNPKVFQHMDANYDDLRARNQPLFKRIDQDVKEFERG